MMKKIIVIILLLLSSDAVAQNKPRFTSIPSISVHGVYTRNLSDFKEIFPNSAGGYFTYSWYFPTKFSLDIRTGYMQQSTTDSTSGFSQSIIPVHIGGRYYFTDFTKGAKINPYVSFMNGMNLIFEEVEQNTVLDTNSGFKGRYAFQVGTGVRFFASKNWYIDVNANYNNSFYQTEAMMTGFEYNIGVGYRIR